jgi:hypothetical protein
LQQILAQRFAEIFGPQNQTLADVHAGTATDPVSTESAIGI